MTKLLTLQLEKSEKLQRLNTIQAKDEPTAEERQERDGLVQRLQEIEPELRAEMVLADGHQNQRTDSPTAEVRDYLGLVSRSRLHRFASAGLGDAQVDGAEAELRQADGLTDNKIPWGLLLPEGEPVLETRADATTGIPSNLPAVQQQILARVFAPGVSDFLGVRTVSVGTGQAVFPVLTTGSSVAQVARGAGKDATAGAFGSDVLKPRRLTGRIRLAVEDMAGFSGLGKHYAGRLASRAGRPTNKTDCEREWHRAQLVRLHPNPDRASRPRRRHYLAAVCQLFGCGRPIQPRKHRRAAADPPHGL